MNIGRSSMIAGSLRTFLLTAAFWLLTATASAHPSSGIVVDGQGNVYFSDLSRGLFRIDASGKLTDLHLEGSHWLALDPSGSFSNMEFEKSSHWPRWFKRRTPAGVRPALIADGGSPLVVAGDGNLYYVCNDEKLIPGGLQVARLTADGKALLLDPGMRSTVDGLGGIRGLALGPDGSLFASFPRAILKISLDGKLTPLLDPVVVADCDRHPPSLEDPPFLRGLAVDARGTVYAAATGCRCVIKVSHQGQVSTVLKAESPWAPCGVAAQGQDLYVLEHINANSEAHEDWPPRVRKLGPDGKVTVLVDLSAPPLTDKK